MTKIVKPCQQWWNRRIWQNKFAKGLAKIKMTFHRGYFGENGKFGEQPPKSKQYIPTTSQRGPLKVAILTNVPNLAKMASIAKIRQPRNYMPNEIAKEPLGKWRIRRNSSKMWLNFLWYVRRVPFNSGDFDQNGKHGDETKLVNSSFSPNLPFSSKSPLFKRPL